MTTEERLEKLEKELAVAKQINRWKLVVVALAVSLLCMVAKEGLFVAQANAGHKVGRTKPGSVMLQSAFVTGNANEACLWRMQRSYDNKGKPTSSSKLVFINRVRAQ